MGYGSYSANDWQKLKNSRKLESNSSVEEVFTRKECDPKMNPKYIATRECFDSEDHPNTTPIVVGLDVTASMGYLAVDIATGALNELITKLYSTGAVTDPSLMCAAYGDYEDRFPLQVTQFESDIRIAQQLLDIYFENGGQNEVVPTCLWEFLSRHTDIDAIKKRNQKGFVFTIGDEAKIRENWVGLTIYRTIGDKLSFETRDSVLEEVQQKFHVFHIVINSGRRPNQDKQFMNGHLISITRSEISAIPEIVIGTIQLQNGEPLEKILDQWDPLKRPTISNALSQLQITGNAKRISL